MSFVIAVPELVRDAATNLAAIGSTISSANAEAAAPTTGLLAAGADEVSAAVAATLSRHASGYHALSAQAAAFHSQFLQALSGAGDAYATSDAANPGPLQTLLGRPLIGNGADGTTNAQGVGTPGGPGGILWGSGGNGGNSNTGTTFFDT